MHRAERFTKPVDAVCAVRNGGAGKPGTGRITPGRHFLIKPDVERSYASRRSSRRKASYFPAALPRADLIECTVRVRRNNGGIPAEAEQGCGSRRAGGNRCDCRVQARFSDAGRHCPQVQNPSPGFAGLKTNPRSHGNRGEKFSGQPVK